MSHAESSLEYPATIRDIGALAIIGQSRSAFTHRLKSQSMKAIRITNSMVYLYVRSVGLVRTVQGAFDPFQVVEKFHFRLGLVSVLEFNDSCPRFVIDGRSPAMMRGELARAWDGGVIRVATASAGVGLGRGCLVHIYLHSG
jgi:hypothetical protein